ncbi:hypothetical protein B0H12DRAFT_1247034 [Mycena haematopus]|nr:hypothetical protein B0H12DRAFT_1247034 [Mycena haematopus]
MPSVFSAPSVATSSSNLSLGLASCRMHAVDPTQPRRSHSRRPLSMSSRRRPSNSNGLLLHPSPHESRSQSFLSSTPSVALFGVFSVCDGSRPSVIVPSTPFPLPPILPFPILPIPHPSSHRVLASRRHRLLLCPFLYVALNPILSSPVQSHISYPYPCPRRCSDYEYTALVFAERVGRNRSGSPVLVDLG